MRPLGQILHFIDRKRNFNLTTYKVLYRAIAQWVLKVESVKKRLSTYFCLQWGAAEYTLLISQQRQDTHSRGGGVGWEEMEAINS